MGDIRRGQWAVNCFPSRDAMHTWRWLLWRQYPHVLRAGCWREGPTSFNTMVRWRYSYLCTKYSYMQCKTRRWRKRMRAILSWMAGWQLYSDSQCHQALGLLSSSCLYLPWGPKRWSMSSHIMIKSQIISSFFSLMKCRGIYSKCMSI